MIEAEAGDGGAFPCDLGQVRRRVLVEVFERDARECGEDRQLEGVGPADYSLGMLLPSACSPAR